MALNDLDQTLFDEVQEDIFELMLTDSFPRFLKSDQYNEYCKERHPEWFTS
jgi:hypothetical protein